MREGAAYLCVLFAPDLVNPNMRWHSDQYKAGLIALKAQELSQNKHLQELSALWKNQDVSVLCSKQFSRAQLSCPQETVDNLRGMYPSLIEDLSHRRSAQINDASESSECVEACKTYYALNRLHRSRGTCGGMPGVS